MKMKPELRKQFRVKQEVEERAMFDARWTLLNIRLKEQQSGYEEPP